jgi:Abnormal spindle-like microcephaly-assoc'd, ASPM-SPD-2-Hydin/Beta-propeller repeat
MKRRGGRGENMVKLTVIGTLICGLLLLAGYGTWGNRARRGRAAGTSIATDETTRPAHEKPNPRWVGTYNKLPLSFEENQGQTAGEVRYLSHGSGYELFLTAQEAVLALSNPVRADLSPRHRAATLAALRKARQANQRQQLAAVRLGFEGANPKPQIMGTGEMPGKVNYFIGNDPKKWHTDVPTYMRVKYTNLYPGIDLVFYGNQRRLEYDFVVAPGADPKGIRLNVEGARKLRVNTDGDLVLSVSGRKIEFQKPVVYQQVNGKRHEIAGRYAVVGAHLVTFLVGKYDRKEPLILDPVLNFSTYLGGTLDEIGLAIAVDGNHNVVVAGSSTSTNFPTTSNAFTPQPLASNGGAAFVTEINPAGTQLVYSTYLAGSTPAEIAMGVAVDPSGKIYVTGETASSDFPTNSTVAPLKPGPNPANANVGTSFLTKLDPAALTGAASLVYSSYIGGPNGEFGNGVAADSSGNAYVTGITLSPPGSGGAINNLSDFPVTASAIQTFLSNTNGNAFLTRIDTTQSGNASLIYSTYLGGNGANAATLGFGDQALGVAVDTSSNAYLIGTTSSSDFPTTSSAFQQNTSPPGAVAKGTAFISRINTTAGSLVYSSYLGGEDSEFGTAIALGPNNVAYLTGSTTSLTFPTTSGAFQAISPTPLTKTEHAFVGLIDTGKTGSASRTYATYLGSNNVDTGNGIRADALGNAYVAGSTVSAQFPITPGAFQPVYPGAQSDGFVTELNPGDNGNADLIYSTFFGGGNNAGHDLAQGIALDTTNNIYITGQTVSSDLPVFPKPGAFQTSLNGTSDAFIAKLTLIPTLVVSPTMLNFGTVQIGTTSAAQTITLTNNTNNAITFTSAAISGGSPAAANTDYAVSGNTCGASIPAGTSNTCTVSVTFNPSVAAMETANLVLTDGDSTSPQSIALTGMGANPAPAVGLAPTSLSFGNQLLNTTSAAQTVTLTNTGTGPLTINSLAASGDFAGTSTGTTACPISPTTLAAGANCKISVTFTPTATGPRMGTLTVSDNASGSPHTVPLSGTGTAPAVSFAPTSLSFGNQALTTTSAPQTVTLTNTGTSPLTISLIAASGDFAQTSTGTSACPISPATLAANANCTISVTFTPTATGPRSGTLTVTDNASGSPHTVPLTGTGSTAPDFTLSISPNTLTVAQGAVGAPVTISVNSTNGFNAAVALTCTGAPAKSSCALSPASITSSTTAMLTFTAHAMLVPMPNSKPAPPLSLPRIVPLFVALMLLFVLRSTRRLSARLAMVSTIVICLTLAACSGPGGPAKTAKGTYPLTITGTSGTLSHNTTVTVTVN